MFILGHRLSNFTPEGIESADLLRHLYILGKTGSGKSTSLLRILSLWMEEGNGLALIDPHGDLCLQLCHHIPKSKRSNVIIVDPSDHAYPLSWNPLYQIPIERRPIVAQGLIGAFKGVWKDSWGPRMEYILMNALRLLLDAEEESLLGLPRVLVDPGYRSLLERRSLDPVIRQFWQLEFGKWDDRFRKEAIAPIQNKIGQFLSDPFIRSILGQRTSKLDLRFAMDQGKIVLVNLSKGLIGESSANLFGSLFVSSIYEAALSRANVPEKERRPFLLAIDEFHNIATDRFSSALSEARKYGLGLVLSHQFLDQLLPDVRNAVLGNVASMMLFRMGGRDASVFSQEFGHEWPESRFTDLSPFQAILAECNKESGPVPKIIKAAAPLDEIQDEKAIERLISHSRQRYGQPAAEVEDKIHRWMNRSFRNR